MQFDNVYGFIKRFNPMLFWREHFLELIVVKWLLSGNTDFFEIITRKNVIL